jgi:hypothetical protein
VLGEEPREQGDGGGRVGPADRGPSELHAAGQVADREKVVVLMVHGQRRLGMVDGPHPAGLRPLQAGQAPTTPAGQHPAVVILHRRQDPPRDVCEAGFEALHAGVSAQLPNGLANLAAQLVVEPEPGTTGDIHGRGRGARFPAAQRARTDLQTTAHLAAGPALRRGRLPQRHGLSLQLAARGSAAGRRVRRTMSAGGEKRPVGAN